MLGSRPKTGMGLVTELPGVRASWGSKGQSPSPAPLYPQGVGWLEHLSVAQASPGAPIVGASPDTAWNGVRRTIGGKLLGLPAARLTNVEGEQADPSLPGDGGTLCRAARFHPTPTPRRPEIVDLGRFHGP